MALTSISLVRLALGSLAPTSLAVAQCVLAPIHVQRIDGRPLFGLQSQRRIPEKGEVRLLDSRNAGNILEVGSLALIPASVDIEVTRSKASPCELQILAILGADAAEECGGASITVEPKAKVDRALTSARRAP